MTFTPDKFESVQNILEISSTIINDANAIALGQRLLPIEGALQIVDIWLATGFEGGRHVDRIRMIDDPQA